MNENILFFTILAFIAIFIFPLAFKEDNTWWFSILKFWFGIIPIMIGIISFMALFYGPIMAIHGLIYHSNEGLFFLGIYLWLLILFITFILLPNDKIKQLNTF